MARRLHLSRSSNDDGVAEQMGRAIVLFLVENTLFDRSSPLFCRGMEITARMGNGRQVGHTFPQPSSFRVLGHVGQPRERHVWTFDETTDLTKCSISLPCEIYVVWTREMWQSACALSRWQSTPPKGRLDAGGPKSIAAVQQYFPVLERDLQASRSLAERGLRPTHARVASIVSRVRGRAPKLRLHSPPQAASSASSPSFARPLGLLRFSLQQIKLLLTLFWGEACYLGPRSLLRN
jgi:hypothetical protein